MTCAKTGFSGVGRGSQTLYGGPQTKKPPTRVGGFLRTRAVTACALPAPARRRRGRGPAAIPQDHARHARVTVLICRMPGSRVTYYLFAPQGSGRAGRPHPPQAGGQAPSSWIAAQVAVHPLLRLGWWFRLRGSRSPARRSSDLFGAVTSSRSEAGMIVKLPCASHLGWWVCGCVRSLRTQQRALVKCQIILVQLSGWLRIPLDQSPTFCGLALDEVS